MCGIVGVVGRADAVAIVMQGLARLEYRGYDSAGVAALVGGKVEVRKAVGKLVNLEDALKGKPLSGTVAIGHTRWATHGVPSEANAHPHVGAMGNAKVAVVHNGIIENYQALRAELGKAGVTFVSETDTEVIPFEVAARVAKSTLPVSALAEAAKGFTGNFAICAMVEGGGESLVATRKGAPLCVAVGNGFTACVSDPLALAGVAEKFIYLEDGDLAWLQPSGVEIVDVGGKVVQRPIVRLDLSEEAGGKQGHRHFMLKEMHEQPAVLARILDAYTDGSHGKVTLPFELPAEVKGIHLVACGTAYYAGLVGKYIIEELAGIPVNVDVASEFRYRKPPLQKGEMFIAISQSGETADTLAALEHAKAAGLFTLAFTNVPTSSMARTAQGVLPLLAGREVAVASTKAFSAMVLALVLLGIRLSGKARHNEDEMMELRSLPMLIGAALELAKPLEALAKTLTGAQSMLYLGRGALAPLAYEGALKMKEISYIHAEGYASGEMKHGPIALVEPGLPVVNLAAGNDGLFEKTLSNLKEVEARQGRIILITDKAGVAHLDGATKAKATIIALPDAPALLRPLVFAIPLQLLAYFTAVAKGTDVDQPRNLAKSVTVE
jgi:glucosamine--fructose-6-phosphate aminotransferase (isomerizing)